MARRQEKQLMQELNYDFVSDQEDGPEGKLIIRSPSWRSPRANELMSRLQRRIDQSREEEVRPHVPRIEGPLSGGGRACRIGESEHNSGPEEKEEVQTEITVASPPRRRKRYHHFGSDDSETD